MKCSFQWIKSIDLDFINVVPFVAMHILKEAETFPASFLNFKVIKVPAGSDFKVGSPNFKFWRTKKIPCSGGVCSTTLCMFSWFFFPPSFRLLPSGMDGGSGIEKVTRSVMGLYGCQPSLMLSGGEVERRGPKAESREWRPAAGQRNQIRGKAARGKRTR